MSDLGRCIPRNPDCGDCCRATAAMLLRLTELDVDVLRATLEAFAQGFRSCGDEWDRHAEYEHRRVCAEACRGCAEACDRAIEALDGSTTAPPGERAV